VLAAAGEGDLAGLADGGDPAQQFDRGGILEREGERVGDHHPDRAGAAGPQRAPGAARPRVAELAGDGEDVFAPVGGEPAAAGVGVGDGGLGDARGEGDVAHRHGAVGSGRGHVYGVSRGAGDLFTD